MAAENYYDFFDSASNDGYVLDGDRSSEALGSKRLSRGEKSERQKWNDTFNRIYGHYMDDDLATPLVGSTEKLMEQRLIIPLLETQNITTRTRPSEPRAGRLYPPPSQMREWTTFVQKAAAYQPTVKVLNAIRFTVFLDMLKSGENSCRSEIEEESHLLTGLRFLKKAEIVYDILKESATVGRPDFSLIADSERKISVIGESKSTHNLVLPNTSNSLVEKYAEAYETVISNVGVRTNEWAHIAHPLGQLLGYMADNGRRYGALTSSTRTYFVFISGKHNTTRVHISEPYFVGEVGYMRAWGYIHSLGCRQSDTFVAPTSGSKKWIKTSRASPTPQPKEQAEATATTNKRNRRRKGSGGQAKRQKTAAASLDLPILNFWDLKFGERLGSGRNGSVFKVCWGGNSAAVKQFDVGRDGDENFDKEVCAYARTRSVWGKLVPEPLFLSESPSGGVKFLGLQPGRPLNDEECENDDLFCQQWQSVLATLENEFGIQHNDARGNAIVIETNGEERLVAIDFEDWEDLFN
jgi:hypothetical protein